MKRLYEYNVYGKVIIRLTLFSIFILLALTITSDYAYAHKYPHIKSAALTYSLTDEIGADFVGRHYDMAINPSGQNYTIIKNIDPQVKCLLYLTISSIRGNDYSELQQFCNQMGYNYDSMFHWANDNVCIDAIAPSGSPCTGNTTCTDPGNRTEFCGWNTFRSIPDFSKPEMWDWIIYKYLSKMGDRYDGVMEDEAVFYYHPNWNYYSTMMCFPFQPSKWSTGGASDMSGWEGFTHDQIRDSLLYLKQNVWLPMMMDSLRAHGKQRYPNPAAYGVLGSDIIDDVILTGTGVLIGEGMHLSPILGSSYFNNAQAWNIMDTIATSEGSAILWCEINQSESLSLGSWARCQMERVCWYYMKADTQHFYFLLTGNSPEIGANDYRANDSLYKWCPAFEYDIGQPLGSMYDAASGVDPAGQAYTMNARNFENAVVLYRKASGSNYSNSSAVTYDLGGQYQQLYSDGTLGGVTSDASVRNCEGKIYIPYSGANNPPSAPSLYSPSYGENIDERQPYLIVNNASDPDGQDLTYSFQVATDNQFTNIVASVNGIAEGSPRTQWQVSVILDPDTDYYWRARAHDGITYGNYSSTGMFHINAGYNNPPSAPVVYSPVNGDTITNRQPYLIVNNASDPDGDTKTYSYEVARDNQFNNMVALVNNIQEGTTRTQWQIDIQLEVNDDYYWRCRAHDGTVYGDYSAVSSFRVAGANSAPGAPSICQPGIGDTVDVARPLLYVYNASDPDGDDLTYLYEIYDMDSSLVSVDSSVAENPDSTAWQVQVSLDDDASYWWRVRAYDGSVYGEYSEDGVFFVDISDRPGPTTIRWPEPGDTIGTIQPTLWINNAIDPDGDSLVYSFQLYDSSWQPVEEGWPIPETPDTTAWQTPELQDLSLYYWRARAFDGIEFGDFTQNGHFYINVNYQPTVPVAMNPAQGDTIIDPQPTLWLSNSSDPDNDPLSYHFQLFTADSTLLAQATEVPEGDDSTGWTLPGMLENETSYAWRARAYDGKLYSDWCDGIVFTVYIFGQAAGDGIPELMGDAREGGVVNSANPVLSIANAAGPSQYYFEVSSTAEFDEDKIIASSGAVDAGDEATVWQVNPDLSTGKMYYWRASSDQNSWSDPDSFFVSLGIHVFPNPYRPARGHEAVTFRNLPDDSQIKVATVSGKIVREFKNVPEGDYQWDVHNESGSALATGVYLYIINYPGGTSNGKLAVIR